MPRLSRSRLALAAFIALLLLATLAFIWGNSLFSPAQSMAQSRLFEDILRPIAMALPIAALHTPEGLSLLTRKPAHFAEYFVLGLELMALSLVLTPVWKPSFWLLLVLALAAAAADELLQFVSARGPSLWDVLLDGFGALCGLALLRALCFRRVKRA